MIYYCQFIGCSNGDYVAFGIIIILFFAVGIPMLLIAKIHELIKKLIKRHRATRTAVKDADRNS